jgi:Nucleotidyl transferase AbiEii toxin, Type IV TA system
MASGDSGAEVSPELTAFQLEVTRLFFALPESRGFLLAGGAALLAQHLTTRPTEDLDFFTAPGRGHVPAARAALESAARQRGWSTERIHDSDTFCRLIIADGAARVLVDLAVNAPPDAPASPTAAGPTLAPEELARHKLLALFDRAAARDFADVYVLARRFGKDVLLARAGRIDAGFDSTVLASMLATLDRFADSEIPLPDDSSVAELNQRHLMTVLREYEDFYNTHRPHPP